MFLRSLRSTLAIRVARCSSSPSSSSDVVPLLSVERKQFHRSDMLKELENIGVQHRVTDHIGYIHTDCPQCGEHTAFISPSGEVHCTLCTLTLPFHDYQERIRASNRERKEEKEEDEEAARTKENLGRMGTIEQHDADLYDNIAYLDLVAQYENNLEKKRRERHERIRKIMDDAETLSPREDAPPVTARLAPAPIDPAIKHFWDNSIAIADLDRLDKVEIAELQMMLGIERIGIDTLARYNIRAHMSTYDQPSILYPRYRGPTSRSRVPTGLKLIRRIGDAMEKENYPILENRFNGMFGLHLLTASDRKVILTTNERDALAVYEATDGLLAIALPHGEKIDEEVLPYLEYIDRIYLWFPHKHLGYARDWAHILNASRCYLVRSRDRPVELLRQNKWGAIRDAIELDSVLVRDRGFRSLFDVREEIRGELLDSRNRHVGIAIWKRFDALNKYLGGFRPGEMTVLTGATGVGKTTFLCEYSLDLFMQGVRTLFCSFEMPEEKILKWMLVQFAGPAHLRSLARSRSYQNGHKLPLHRVENHPLVDQWLDKFERMKTLTIMKNEEFRDKSIVEIINAIKVHVLNSGIQHVVIDNLQFLVGQSILQDDGISAIERHNLQDRMVGLLRRLASDAQVHITMVVHPRKVDSETDLDVQHFGGSAKITQEADNVLAIQQRKDDRGKKRKFLYILKNRYGGRRVESDSLEMLFQPSTFSHTLVDLSK